MTLRARYGAAGALVYRMRAVCRIGLLIGLLAATPAHAADRLIWALGDSLTAGYGLPPSAGFTNQLELALRRGGIAAQVRNGGISGDTTAQGRARLLWGLRGLRAKPDLVIVELGANDMLRGLPPTQARTNLDYILTELRRRNIPILLAGMKASRNLGPDYAREFDGVYPALARKHGIPLYPFFMDGIAGNRGLVQSDGLHPNARGVRVLIGRFFPAVRSALVRPQR